MYIFIYIIYYNIYIMYIYLGPPVIQGFKIPLAAPQYDSLKYF